MEKGLPFEVIPELEQSEFNDWLAASRALDIDHKLVSMNVAASPYYKSNERASEFNKLKNEQMILLGENPYELSPGGIEKTRLMLQKQGRVRKVNGNHKGNSCQTKT